MSGKFIALRAMALVAALLINSIAGGAQAPLTGPVFGYVFDPAAGGLRPLRGILGSATLGPAGDLGYALSWAMTLDARHILVSRDDSPNLLTLDMGASPPAIAPIEGVPARPSVAAVSAHGTSAAFYYAATQKIWIVTGLPLKPATARVIDLSAPGPITHIAVSDNGQLLACAMDEGSGQGVYGWTPALSEPSLLMPAAAVGGIAMTESGTVIVADRGTNEIFAAWETGSSSIRRLLAGAEDGVSNPVGVTVSTSNRIHIANADAGAVLTVDLSSRLITSQQCGCDISGVRSVMNSLFRLTDRVDRTIYLLDTSSSDAHILFVPNPENAQ